MFTPVSTRYLCSVCNKKYNNKNKDSIKKYNKERYESNKNEILSKIKIYHSNNKESIKEYAKDWFQKNKEHVNLYNREKYKNDIEFKIKTTLRNMLNNKLKSQNEDKINSSINLLGCSIEEFKLHLEKQFLPEMTWENHGNVWEIDHIKPCSLFNLVELKQQQECFHYTNMQPLFKTTQIAESYGYKNHTGNRNKSNKF
jgi:hypothetical protein